jgi:orotate phosphoribosyltransferase
MMNYSKEIAAKLLETNAVKLRPEHPFQWASGWLSPIYCDNRVLLSYPKVRNLIVNGMLELSSQFGQYDYIAGVATAGIPHGMLLADRQEKPFVYVRAKAKEHGRQNQIEGYIPEGSKALVVEDLISTGMSSLQAVDALHQAGVQVVGVIAIFTYAFPQATQAFEQASCPLYTLTDYPTLLEVAQEQGYIEAEALALLDQWRIAPDSWKP